MKKNKFARAALAAMLAVFMLAGMNPALAEPADPPEAEESEVEIRFEEGNGGVAPVDPDNPGEPLDPDNPDLGTGQSGPLALNYISPITFGLKKIFGAKKAYNATTMKPFVQVTDLRGTDTGWILTAEAAPFRNESGEVSLAGSVITFERGAAVSAVDGLLPPRPAPVVNLPTDGETMANVAEADDGEGFGTWVIRWYPSTESPLNENDSVTLTVLPGTATLEKHTAKITWTLAPDVKP